LALESQLRESQKMQAIGTMAGGIAHDFNNIISAILGNVKLALQDAQANSAVSVSLTEIGKAGRRARDLVRQILTFSRNEPPHRAALQLADVVHETIRLVKVTLPPNVNLRVSIDPKTPPVMADATQIEQALINLCTNAIHAIDHRPGCIHIELGYSMEPSEDLNKNSNGLRGSHVKLLVSDTGHGMSRETLERIFEPFFTTKPVGQGTGLGLSVVHGIMRTHLGSVHVESTPEKGSQFTLYFPIANTPVLVKENIDSTPNKVIGNGQRVMYVDDDEALVFLVNRVLTRKGFSVITFTNPREALEVLRANPLEVDLLVTDFNMPGYSGIELLRDAHSIRPDMPIALASGYVTPEIESEALLAGARALIHKPNDVDELCQTVQDLLTHNNDRN
jgi:CheY-like chemotaxis protein